MRKAPARERGQMWGGSSFLEGQSQQFGNKPHIPGVRQIRWCQGRGGTSLFGEPAGISIKNLGFRVRQARVQVQTLLVT